MTSQRRLILETLEDSPDHPTAEDIYIRARQNDASLHLSTVYRTLHWLEDEGLVSPRLFEDEERRQERFDPVTADSSDHYHFRCRICNGIFEFSEPRINLIKEEYQAHYGGQVESASLVYYGVCKRCLTITRGK